MIEKQLKCYNILIYYCIWKFDILKMLKHLIVKNIESGERKIESDPSTVDDGQTKRKKPMRHGTTT